MTRRQAGWFASLYLAGLLGMTGLGWLVRVLLGL
jgi:hypothetical protein